MPQTLISALSDRGLAVAAQAPALPAGGDVPDWIEVMPAGTIRGVDGRGPWTLADAKAVVAASLKEGRPLPVDFNHQTVFAVLNGGESPAAGWIDRLEDRDGAIWAHVEWTERGRTAVAAKDYRFVSPTFQHDRKTGRVRRIESVALVNNPNIAELPAIASQTGGETAPMEEFLSALRNALGLPATADQDAILSACRGQASAAAQRPINDALKPLTDALGLAANASVASVVAAARERITAGVDPAQYVPIAAFQELQGQVAELSTNAAQAAAKQAVDQAVTAGKVIPALRDWATGYAARDPQGFAQWVAAAPAIVQPGGSTTGGNPPPRGDALNGAELEVCAKLGLSAEDYKAALAAEAGDR